jgi:prophage regulatory protein
MPAHAHRLTTESVQRRFTLPGRHDEPADATRHEPTEPATVRVDVIVRLPRVQQLSGLGRSTIYRLMSMHMFPSAVRLGPRAVGWRLSDIAAWSASRPGLASPDPAAPESPTRREPDTA